MITDLSRFFAIAFDADDTLWHNERFFQLSQSRFVDMLSDYADPKNLEDRLMAAELRNMGHYGFGVKGFTLSMIETAIDVTDGAVHASVIKELLKIGQDMLQHPMELLEGAHLAVATLSQSVPLYVITKGDLLHQERKLAQSNLGDYFTGVEIVSDKTPAVYQSILDKIGCAPDEFLMIGNSVKSDILPVLDIGGWACFVPFEISWQYEVAQIPTPHPRFKQITSLLDFLKS
jgi:putative hydrolase of the HAD superfamily